MRKLRCPWERHIILKCSSRAATERLMSDVKPLRRAKGSFLMCHLFIKSQSFTAAVPYTAVRPECIAAWCIEYTCLSSCLPVWTHSATPFSSSYPHAYNHTSRCSHPGLKGLKVFSAIKRARLIPESIFRSTLSHTHTQDMSTCMHGEQTIIFLGLPCWFPLFTTERFVVG